jgi:primosomal protein N' (replication factor Y) (superfamily II helicase)
VPVLADVLTSANAWNSEQPLLTYLVPAELQAELCAGQLVAVPYGDRLVEGIVWHVWEENEHAMPKTDSYALRPISTILDLEPALLPHQRALAEWMAGYYVTPLAQVALMMLPPGLMQRSKVVLHLIKNEDLASKGAQDQLAFTRLRALVGLLLAEGELDIERLEEMLGPKLAKEVIQEALSSSIIEREATLHAPATRARHKRVVRLIAEGKTLESWR